MQILQKFTLASVLLASCAAFTSCSKDDDTDTIGGTSRLEVRLTDAPGDYLEVNVNIQAVEIHASGNANDNDNGWQPLTNINAGIYNLLDFANGHDTLLASADLPVGTISQIRLKLANTGNTVKLNDGTIHTMDTPSGQQSGLKLQVHAPLQRDVTYVMLLDFDAARSVKVTGNGQYKLKPVINVITNPVAGGIRGTVNPAGASPAIYVLSGAANTDTIAGGFTDNTGQFLIRGLAAGTYTVRFDAADNQFDKTVSGVSVTNTDITNMGTVNLP